MLVKVRKRKSAKSRKSPPKTITFRNRKYHKDPLFKERMSRHECYGVAKDLRRDGKQFGHGWICRSFNEKDYYIYGTY